MSSKYELPTDEERLAAEFEKLGRLFFAKVEAKNFTQAYKILDQLTAPSQHDLQETKIYEDNQKLI
ncbi:hypothetical protein P7E02_09635 [Enterococcus hulanensis]|uniref:hypothetical protein n=1 Tax=Enterococcus TaxID=1350 RepID=UPI000B5A7F13|nr:MULTISPECIES: hypothetical protein [Enterococcus]MBO0413451.1 hypothetical protein [Enterococcus hulanensis]MDT2660132.1 hypothetical protein [Enterococcus hulanensis]OTO20725.1 hypothetical protein A5875_002078 [Enterococcus sp. 3H8_DIV0648]